ncbi:MAG: chromate transporter [bacterium]|nr:chromate transporter [bacterium]
MKKIKSLIKLFYLFSIMGIQMFGNLVTMIPIFENELVTKRKLITNEDVLDAITIGRCGPGAAIVNTIAFIGNRIDGFLGGVFAVLGFCFFPFLVILIISYSIDTFLNDEIIKHFLKGVSTCISVMIINSMIDFGKKTLKSKICLLVFIVTLLLSITTNIPIVCYLIICVILSIFLKIDF